MERSTLLLHKSRFPIMYTYFLHVLLSYMV